MNWKHLILEKSIRTSLAFQNALERFCVVFWPGLKTSRLVNRLQSEGVLDNQKVATLPRLRRFRRWYINLFCGIPFLFCAAVFLISVLFYPEDSGAFLGFIYFTAIFYVLLRDDFEDEWKFIHLLTEGRRTRGKVFSVRKSLIGNAVHAQFYFENKNGIGIQGRMFLWHGIAPNFSYKEGDEVEVIYDPYSPLICAIVTEEVEAFNLKKAQQEPLKT